MKFLLVLAMVVGVVWSACTPGTETALFTYGGSTAVEGKNMNMLTCEKDTQIDFNFPQETLTALNVTATTGTSIKLQLASNSLNDKVTLQFLDRTGVNRSYTMRDITLSLYSAGARVKVDGLPSNATDLYQLSVTYQNISANADMVVSIYLAKNLTNYTNNLMLYQPGVSNYQQLNKFWALVRNINAVASGATSISGLEGLAAFNQMDLSKFFTQYNGDGNCSTSYLLNFFVFEMDSATSTAISTAITTSPYADAATSYQAKTGNLLCWGSNTNLGTFQTHMRDNYALWAVWISVLIWWISLLFGEATTLNCFDKKFEDNKWTNWSYYSLWYLAHEQFFTRMMRMVPLYTNFSWQACVAAILYAHLGPTYQDPSTIAWFGAIAFACSIPLPWIFGIFTRRVYAAQLQKYNQQNNIRKLFDKEGNQARIYQDRIDACQSTIYGSYYWMYVFGFTCFVTFWTLSINRLQELPRELYHQQKYWLAALGVAWAIDVFVYEPLMTLAFGSFGFYKFRPYFYDYKIGELYKELEG